MKKLTTVALELLMYWLLVQPSSQASMQAATVSSPGSRGRPAKNNTTETNICDLKLEKAPVFCHCDTIDLHRATESKCVVLDVLKVDDPIWEIIAMSQPKLQNLELVVRAGSDMSYVPTKTLRVLRNLTRIELKDANIGELVEKAFSDIQSLTAIHVRRCSIVHLKKYAFGNMTKLDAIFLDENRIHEINRDVFVNLPSLKKLVINKNNLTLIHDKALKHLSTLEVLELRENKISVITSDTFAGLKSLKHLSLSGNVIEMIGDKTFVEVPELQVLELDQNKIEFVVNGALEGLRNLRKLSLSDNKLVRLGTDILSGTPSLNFLDLRSNALKTITFEHIKPILQELYNATGHLYLDDNKFICDCRLAWIFGVRNETSNKVLRDSLGSLTCFLESQDENIDDYDVENNETGIEVKQNSGESYEISKKENAENEDEDETEDENNPNSESEGGKLQKIDGKLGYIKHISDLKFDDLPCPEQQEAVGSEQSSSRRENAPMQTSSGIKTQITLSSCVQLVITIVALAVM
ncbi:connectin [Fopius arisanus]|uniref:Con_0 protein n=2 Tax=Fopius arisanus TaxID=64838 RepID=A0A0C9RLU0_9HYME|nr:PREDICTED: connectin-like [Fopius arisanus]